MTEVATATSGSIIWEVFVEIWNASWRLNGIWVVHPLSMGKITLFDFVFLAGGTVSAVVFLLCEKIRGKDNSGEEKVRARACQRLGSPQVSARKYCFKVIMGQILDPLLIMGHNCQARQWRIFEAGFVPCASNTEEGEWVEGASGDETIAAPEAGSN